MPPILAAAITLLFIAYLFFRDHKQGFTPSLALCIPCIWMIVLGSRSLTEWFYLGAPMPSGGGDAAEGSPIERAFFFLLMAVGFVVLAKRGLPFGQVAHQNLAFSIFMLYCGVSIVWSDFPFVAFKRWFKEFGDPIMVLIILTEPNPLKAAEIVLRVCINLLVPLSVLFIKYYPHLGKAFTEWGGNAFTGVTTNKNILGFTLMVYGLFLIWRLSVRWGQTPSNRLDNVVIPLVLLAMVGWLFNISDSKTPLLSLGLAILIFFSFQLKMVRNHFTACLLTVLLVFGALQWTLNITSLIIEGAGRDTTFTGRTEVWAAVLEMQDHPILGFGVESFWLGDRLTTLQERWFFRPNQAHSGYIEMYLHLGIVGLTLFACVLVSYYRKCLKTILARKTGDWVVFARLGMAFLFAYLAYNYTEAAFKTPHFLYLVFLLFSIGLSHSWGLAGTPHQSPQSSTGEVTHRLAGVMRPPSRNQRPRERYLNS